MDLIDAVYQEHGQKNQWELGAWCQEYREEWTPLAQGWERIALERSARAVGKTDEQIARLKEQAEELHFLSTALGR
jgi:hypothetical protein